MPEQGPSIDQDTLQRLTAERDALVLLQKLGAQYVQNWNLKEVLATVVEAAVTIAGADFGNIQLLDPVSGDLAIVAQQGFPDWWIEFWQTVSKGQGICGTALEKGERVIVEDVEHSPLFAGTPALEIQLRAGVRAIQSTPLIGRSGNPLGMLSTHYKTRYRPGEQALHMLDLLARQVVDIIERAHTEEALRTSEERLQALMNATSDVVYRMNPDWTEMRQLIGRDFIVDTPEPTRTWLERYIPPDDQPQVLAVINEAIRTKSAFELEHRVLRSDGSLGWTSSRAIPIVDAAGEISEWFGIARDITRRKHAEVVLAEREAQYRAVIETAEDGFWMIDERGQVLAVNDTYARRSGYAREELLGMSIRDLEARESAQEIFSHIAKVKRDGSDRFETLHRTKAGEIWPVEINAAYWASAGGRFFVFARDLTERKRDEARLKTLNSEMEQLINLHVASQTVAALAHELNQPLNAVSSYAEAALRLLHGQEANPERLQRAIEGSAREAQRAGQVVRELMAFLRRGEVQTEAVDLNDVVLQLAARLDAGGSRAVRTRLELEANLPPVNANRQQIEKVLANLVDNGIEAMLPTRIDPWLIAITVRTATDGRAAHVTVSDNGPGIDSTTLQHIFDPFFTTKPSGLGMGLAISRAIIEAHGGQLWADSDEIRGANFHFTLPFAT